MLPYLDIFGFQLPMYGLLAAVGAIVAGIFICYQVKKRGYDDDKTLLMLMITVIGVILGSHLLYGLTNISRFKQFADITSFSDFWDTLSYVFGGAVFYGGLIAGIVVGLLTIKLMKLDLSTHLDVFSCAVPLFHGFARIGCFCAGCCYGIESEFGFCAHGNTLTPDVNDVTRFPVQLVEAACNFILFFVLWYLLRSGKLRGKLFSIYLIAYAVIRFIDEFWRGDAIRGFIFGMSTSQFIAIIMVLFAVLCLIFYKPKACVPPAEKTESDEGNPPDKSDSDGYESII